MKFRLALAVGVLICLPNGLLAQESGKTMRSNGRVIAITQDSLTIQPGNTNLVFAVDGNTKVVGKGVGTKVQAIKKDGRAPTITDLVDKFDSVNVKYVDTGGGKLRATEVDIKVKTILKK
ncbi:MAG: hypothetical protein AAB403_23545 [Planctomycetota bacterium]